MDADDQVEIESRRSYDDAMTMTAASDDNAMTMTAASDDNAMTMTAASDDDDDVIYSANVHTASDNVNVINVHYDFVNEITCYNEENLISMNYNPDANENIAAANENEFELYFDSDANENTASDNVDVIDIRHDSDANENMAAANENEFELYFDSDANENTASDNVDIFNIPHDSYANESLAAARENNFDFYFDSDPNRIYVSDNVINIHREFDENGYITAANENEFEFYFDSVANENTAALNEIGYENFYFDSDENEYAASDNVNVIHRDFIEHVSNANENTASAVDENFLQSGGFIRLKNVSQIRTDRTETSTTDDTFSAKPHWDMSVYENRLKTFDNGWVLPFITPIQMAKAGLYYLGINDRVRCVMCSTVFGCWKRDVEPYDEHKRMSPDCQFFKENTDGESSITDVPEVISDRFNNYQKVFNSRDIVLSHNKSFTSFETRFETFEKCVRMKQEPRRFCDAGLYYIGDGENDRMLCFCCNQGLMDWEYHDDPWVEHARWSPNCSFVLLSKGKDFVEQVLLESDDKTFREKLDKLKSYPNSISKALAAMNLKNSSQDEIVLPDSMLCKICYKEKMEVLSIPCGHIVACIQCAVTLDQCAVCRHPYSAIVRIDICVKERINHLNMIQRSPPQCSDKSIDLLACMICRKEEMSTVFVPCTHIACCEECAVKTKACPVCLDTYLYYLPVFM